MTTVLIVLVVIFVAPFYLDPILGLLVKAVALERQLRIEEMRHHNKKL